MRIDCQKAKSTAAILGRGAYQAFKINRKEENYSAIVEHFANAIIETSE
jgi:hypothetical protein